MWFCALSPNSEKLHFSVPLRIRDSERISVKKFSGLANSNSGIRLVLRTLNKIQGVGDFSDSENPSAAPTLL